MRLIASRWPVRFGLMAVAITCAALVLISGVFVWSPLHCWHEYVDIRSGRLRFQHYLLYVCVSDRTEETWLSRAVPTPLGPPAWRRVNTFSPGARHSPHYAYHGAITTIRRLDQRDALASFTPEAKSNVAQEVLRRWRTGDNASASDYIETVLHAAAQGMDERTAIGCLEVDAAASAQ